MTALFKKLNFKDQKEIVAINAPASFDDELKAMQSHAKIITNLQEVEKAVFVLCFLKTQQELDHFISTISSKLFGDVILWLCYPKSSSKNYKCEFNRDTGFQSLGQYGLEGVRQVAIDEDWSALRFRKVEFIKTITRKESFALTDEAKKRTSKKGQ
jgi:hypothetical protein